MSVNNKDFCSWCIEKIELHNNRNRVFFHEREVWFASVGVNIGYEQDGKGSKFLRPIIVIKKFNNETLWGITLSSKRKFGKYYFTVNHSKNRISTANLSQLRLVDSKRLHYKMGDISLNDFKVLKERLRDLL